MEHGAVEVRLRLGDGERAVGGEFGVDDGAADAGGGEGAVGGEGGGAGVDGAVGEGVDVVPLDVVGGPGVAVGVEVEGDGVDGLGDPRGGGEGPPVRPGAAVRAGVPVDVGAVLAEPEPEVVGRRVGQLDGPGVVVGDVGLEPELRGDGVVLEADTRPGGRAGDEEVGADVGAGAAPGE
ncbi:hypothetical protein [Streptomyces albidoflavus]|uniref:hypothetical protein n=1 Tax=Streptomyces albidoflavus TaxID=1886 RepID=UPI001C3F032B|nr:hypothetical protein [Streptomyces albidoflavus]